MKIQAKRLFSVLFAVIMLLAAFSVGNALAASSGKSGENLTWTLDDSGTLTISGTGEIPDESLLPSPERETVKAIVIEDGVTGIGNMSFFSFTCVKSVTIPKSVTKIDVYAFIACLSLTDFTVDEGNTVYSSKDGVLLSKDKATLIMYPCGRTDDTYLIPSSVENIGSFAFGGCDNLKDMTIPESVKSIGSSAFSGCAGLKSIVISKSVTTLGEDLFYGCDALESVTLPDGITEISERMFEYCTALKSVTIPQSVTHIKVAAFYGCPGLESLSLPKNVAVIERDALNKCSSLKSITVDEDNAAFSSSDGVLFNKDKTSLVRYPAGKSDNAYVIPNSVSTVEKDAFSSSENLTDVTVPGSVTKIENYSFAFCSGLTNVTLSNGLKEIKDYAFRECKNLSSITIPNSVESIGYSAFSSCSGLNSVVIPESVKTIYGYAFNNCPNLTSVTLQGSEVSIGDYAFGYYVDPETNSRQKTGGFTLSGHSNSAAKNYAYRHGLSFSDLGATHSYETKVTKNATCTVDGEIVYTCTCGDIYTQVIPASGHSPVTIPAIAPTCTESGKTEGKKCASCGEILVKQNNISAQGHTLVVTAGVAPTCTESGKTAETKCSVCGEVLSKQTEVAPLGHTVVVTTKAVAPTCTKNGKTEGTNCSVCGEVIKASKTVKATGHKYKTTTTKATLKKNGSTVTKCTVCKNVKSKSTVAKVSSVKLSKTALTYSGKVQKPTVVVKDSKGKALKNKTDYTVKYSSGCKSVGQYTVTVTFKGKYSGTKTLTFKIVPKGTSVSKLTAGKKQFTASWSKQAAQTTGYELQYSTKSNMSSAKTVTVKKNKTTSSTVKKLKANTKYFVRVRTYKTVKLNGKSVKLYSAWSKVKSVRTK